MNRKLIGEIFGEKTANRLFYFYQHYILDRYVYSKNPLIAVYQMGKVGSQSVYYSIKEYGYHPIIFLHFFDRLKLKNYFAFRLLIYFLNKKKPLKIITLVREPISRNLSAYAHDFQGYFNDKMQNYSERELEHKFFYVYDRHNGPLEWFDREFAVNTGINVYSYDFDKDNGYIIIRENHIEILIMQLEIEDGKKEKIIKNFLELQNFEMKRYNTAEDKSYYKGNYTNFLRSIRIPETYINKMYKSKYFNHFYSLSQKESFLKKWSTNCTIV